MACKASRDILVRCGLVRLVGFAEAAPELTRAYNYSGIGASNDHLNYNYPAPRPLFSDPNWMGPLSSHAEVPTVGFEFLLSSSNGILPSLPEPVENEYADMKFAPGEA
ncbi:hypothetical protein F4680DRAFT_449961 [Xylaria scruposa]|nr:hypothetical protein F4680DRAFT_449961 [Xylaria scruposa]